MNVILKHPTYPAIQVLLDNLYPDETWTINLLGSGAVSVAWEITSDTRCLVLRAMRLGSSKPTTYAREQAILQCLYDKGVPVPRPLTGNTGHLAVDISAVSFDWSVCSKIEGQAIGNKMMSRQVAHQIGELLATLHAIPVTGYGLTCHDSASGFTGNRQTPLAGAKQHWNDYVLWGIHPHVTLETTMIATMFPDYLRELKSYEKTIHAVIADGQAVICHADLHNDHVYLKDDRLSGVIDFEDACALPAIWDFAMSAHYFGWRAVEDILTGYTASVSERQQLLEQSYFAGLVVGVFKLQRQFVRHASVVRRARTLQFIKHTLNRLNRNS